MKRLSRILLPIIAMAAFCNITNAATYRGDAGPSVDFVYDTETEILHIRGTGDMYNYHGSWNYYPSYSQYDSTGNGVDGKGIGSAYSGNSPLRDNYGNFFFNQYYINEHVKTVIIDEGITSIGAAFFYNCTNLTSVQMPSSLKLINYEAFRGCSSLETIEIGPGVEQIMGRWATECSKFNYISVAEGNTNFVSVGGVLYTSDLKVLVCFPEALNTKEYVIPEGTKFTATDALYHLRIVESITIPTTLVDIEYGSFDHCPNLKSLILKSSTPPTLHKSMEGTKLEGIFVPCGEQATYTNNTNWNSYGGGNIQNAVVVEFYVETNNVALGDVKITSRADCEGYQMTITAIPTQFGNFSHWEDNNSTQLTRVIDIDKDDLSIIYRYKAIFDPKPYDVTLTKTTTKINKQTVTNLYQLSATNGRTTIATTGSNTTASGIFHYGDTITLFCDIKAGEGLNFKKWGGTSASSNNPLTYILTENTYNRLKSFSAEIQDGKVTISTATNNKNYGTVSPATKEVNFGDNVTFTATPKPGYKLSYWDDEPDNLSPQLTRTVVATGNKTYKAYFHDLTYTISVSVNDANMGEINGHGTFKYGSNTTLVASAKNGYEFVEWDDNHSTNPSRTINNITADASYSATFRPLKYQIRFLSDDGVTPLQVKTFDYNTMPAFEGTPAKTSTDEFDYTFSHWTPALAVVKGEADYRANFSSQTRSYTIRFLNGDGTTLQTSNVLYGTRPSYSGATTPTKAPTDEFEYTFNDTWTPAITAVVNAQDYTPNFNSAKRKYQITFLNDNGTPLHTSNVEYGAVPTYTGTPTKAATEQYTYSFAGWDTPLAAVTGPATYTATYTPTLRKYAVRFMNGETVLQSEECDYGTTPVYNGSTPTQASDAQYDYTFADSWTPAISTVKNAVDYQANFNKNLRSYTITFVVDGVSTTKSVAYGQTPSYGSTPTKEKDAQYTYTFTQWLPTNPVPVTGDATYTAEFSTETVFHDITFTNEDGTWTDVLHLPLNATIEHADLPKDPDAQYTYTFTGWTPALTSGTKVTGPATYTATYSRTVNEYDITFKGFDGAPVTQKLAYGATPAYNGTPAKASDAQYNYSFTGWTPEIANVTSDAEYTAVFDSQLRSYTITYINGNETTTESVAYGSMPTLPTATKTNTAKYSYSNGTWTPALTSVTGPATYTAQFTETVNKYNITFNYGNNMSTTVQVEYDQMPSVPTGINTDKDASVSTVYTFANNWTPAFAKVTGNATYTAVYNESLRPYTISFVNEDGTPLWSDQFDYNTMPSYDGTTPTKASTTQYDYIHSGWTPALAAVSGDATYTATYSNILRQYTVRFVNFDGSELCSPQSVYYNSNPYYDQSLYGMPQKESDVEYDYVFNGWNPAITNETKITGNATFTAQYRSDKRSYLITFVDYDGTELYSTTYEYNALPYFNAEDGERVTDGTPVRPSDAQHKYTFTGWSPTLTNVSGEQTYTAQYSTADVLYTVTFTNYDGTKVVKQFEYGHELTSVDIPTFVHPQDDHWIYTFNGWSPNLTTTVTANAEYTATYSETVRQYDITFVDGDGSETTIKVDYNEIPVAPFTPSKAETTESVFTFDGTWYPAITAVSGNARYEAQFTASAHPYTIIFVEDDEDNTELQRLTVPYGETPVFSGTRIKQNTVQYSYTENGWTPTLAPVTGDQTYTAAYKSTLNKYNITATSANASEGTTEGSGRYDYGTIASIKASPQQGFHFVRWSDDETTAATRQIEVTGNVEVTAYFAANTNTPYTLNIYTQNIEDDNYTLESRSMTGTTNQPTSYDAPLREGLTAQNFEQVNISGDGSSVLSVYYNRNSYSLTWNTNGGDELTGSYTNGSVKYGTTIQKPNTPTRTGWEFSGWQPSITTMPAEDIVCLAQWTEKGDTPYAIEYWLQNIDNDEYTLASTDNSKTGKTNAVTNIAAIPFEGFTVENVENCTIAADGSGVAKVYYTRNLYTISWIVDGEKIIDGCTNGSLRFGTPISAPANPTKQGYSFAGWLPEVPGTVPAQSVDYVAQWTESESDYTVEHYQQKIDGTYDVMPTETQTLHGTTGSLTAATAQTIEGFTASSFEQATIAADGSTTIAIRYERNKYTLTWVIGDDVVVGSTPYTEAGEVAFGTPIHTPVLEKVGYNFSWDIQQETMPAANLTCTAIWTAAHTPYAVYHRRQSLSGDYPEISTLIEIEATANLLTGDQTQAVARSYEGFTAQDFAQATIAADGSTIVNILYQRNIHQLTWTIGEGNIDAETEYTADGPVMFGAPITAPVLERDGFSYVWDTEIPTTMPDSNFTAAAVWTADRSEERRAGPERRSGWSPVNHNQQALDGSYLTVDTEIVAGLADSLTAAVARTFEGFTAQAFEQDSIAADSSTVVNINYNRNIHQLTWGIGEGNIDAETEYTADGSVMFGAPITAPVLEREGFSYVWDTEIPTTMPDSNFTAAAVWKADSTPEPQPQPQPQIATYTVNHNQQALDGSYLTVDTEIVAGLADSLTAAVARTFEGFTAQAFEQDSIAADSSTVVNINYNRNIHQLTWTIGEGNIDAETEYTADGSVMFGAPITAPVLEREGFSYVWNAEIPTAMPDSNFTAVAVWTADSTPEPQPQPQPQVATYTVNHNQQALDGSYLTVDTEIVAGLADSLTAAVARTFEGFTALAFEQDSIAADSSTVININYSRNKYELKWELNGGTIISSNYTKAGQVAFGTPIVAPDLELKDYAYIWETMPETMPANDITLSPIWTPGPIDEHFDFTVPQVFNGCENMSIEVTNCQTTNVKFEWSINGVVDKSQTGLTFNFPKDAPVSGVITVTGTAFSEKGSSSWSHEIPYTLRKRIITTMWDDVITVVDTAGKFESFKWYHNDVFVSDNAYYCEKGGLTGSYYLIATTADGEEYNSCAENFAAPATVAIKAYPNPTADKIRIQSGNWKIGDRLTITDGNGKIWRSTIVSNPDGEEFDLSNLPQGIYTIKVGNESANVIKL